MSAVHIQRISKKLVEGLFPLLDSVDIKTTDPKKKKLNLLSRALAAFVVSNEAQIDLEQASKSVTDGFEDNGIDAVYLSTRNKLLYIVQSKWIDSGNGCPSKPEIIKFLSGVEDLIDSKFQSFNKKVQDKKQDILTATKDTNYKFKLLLTHTGNQPLSSELNGVIEKAVEKLNNPFEVYHFSILSQKEIYNYLVHGSEKEPINIENIEIHEWGKVLEPYESIYGQVEIKTMIKLWDDYGQNILDENIRKFKGVTNVSNLIKITLSQYPKHFWYFNNGITVLCNGMSSAGFGSSNKTGIFSFKDVSIVNGAQTIGAIGESFKTHGEIVNDARVQIRFINLENAPDGFSKEITRFTNTQEQIESRDFAALDSEQQRLKRELYLDGIQYLYKSGDRTEGEEEYCTIEEATIALSCLHSDISQSSYAHREVGLIWRDTEKGPYKIIFNPKTSAKRLWNAVRVKRIVDGRLSILEDFSDEETSRLAVHGNDFLLHICLRKIGEETINKSDYKPDQTEIIKTLESVIEETKSALSVLFPNALMYNLFKSPQKIQKLGDSVKNRLKMESTLFD